MRTSTTPPPTPAEGDQPPADPEPGRYEPRLHDTVMDVGTKKVGRVMGLVGPYVQLRPVGGGLEWDAHPENLRPATTAEALSAGVALANARSRGECP